jgi:hypothetical protein
MTLEARVENLFRRYRRDSVLLHRPYPPHEGPRTNSKFGGLPNLPAQHEWPRTSNGTPLHFLAQIDCAEIPFRSPLPERGMLFFFGRDDEEQIWNHEPPASDDCLVIYALDAFAATPPRAAPHDLPPIGGYYPRPAWRDYLRDGEKGPPLHVEWPIRPLRMDSWPDPGGLPEFHAHQESGWRGFLAGLRAAGGADTEEVLDAYRERLPAERRSAFERATGRSIEGEPENRYARIRAAATAIFFDSEEGDEGDWPRHWIYVHYAARTILHRPANFAQPSGPTAQELEAAASVWLERSSAAALDEEVPEAAKAQFRPWIAAFRYKEEQGRLGTSASTLIAKSCEAAIRSWSGDRDRAARIPRPVYDGVAHEFGGMDTEFGPQFAQMLGHAPSAQDPLLASDPTVCLLNLPSEDAIGWMFGDMGEATFWIAPRDLAGRGFSKAWGTIEGH